MSIARTARLLIVDDEREICEMLSRHYRFKGFEVVLAANGVEALAVLNNTPVDIVITDLLMPRMDGVTLLKEVHLQFPMIKTVVITGHVRLDILLTAFRYGAETCIYKPLQDMAELDGAIDSALARLRTWHSKLRQLGSLRHDV